MRGVDANGGPLCIKGRLPFGEPMSVEVLSGLAINAEARAECEAARADANVANGDAFNAAWREYARGRD